MLFSGKEALTGWTKIQHLRKSDKSITVPKTTVLQTIIYAENRKSSWIPRKEQILYKKGSFLNSFLQLNLCRILITHSLYKEVFQQNVKLSKLQKNLRIIRIEEIMHENK
jgi:hypothetical protein